MWTSSFNSESPHAYVQECIWSTCCLLFTLTTRNIYYVKWMPFKVRCAQCSQLYQENKITLVGWLQTNTKWWLFQSDLVSFTNHAGLIWSTSITSSLPFSSSKEFESCYHHPPRPQLPLLQPIHTLYCSQLSLPLPWKWSQVAKPAQTLTIALALESYSPTNERRRALWPVLFVGQDAGFQAISQHCLK